MIKSFTRIIKKMTRALGSDTMDISPLHIDNYSPTSLLQQYPDLDENVIEIIDKVTEFPMTSPERIFALCEAVKYIITNDIPGAIVECGVWKGGSMMAIAHTLMKLNNKSR